MAHPSGTPSGREGQAGDAPGSAPGSHTGRPQALCRILTTAPTRPAQSALAGTNPVATRRARSAVPEPRALPPPVAVRNRGLRAVSAPLDTRRVAWEGPPGRHSGPQHVSGNQKQVQLAAHLSSHPGTPIKGPAPGPAAAGSGSGSVQVKVEPPSDSLGDAASSGGHGRDLALKCPWRCGESFGIKRDLAKHIKAAHRSKPFWCPRCGLTYAYEDNVITHARTVHGINMSWLRWRRHILVTPHSEIILGEPENVRFYGTPF
ncbi:hypothetical protein AURDEDRAFT_113726 [Auricularia subglabra TFB-10046 SS5]|nr:hypothetical protein AURDEDRAFT_113726 [Auricularia subglabra TFB-10046 SS5]